MAPSRNRRSISEASTSSKPKTSMLLSGGRLGPRRPSIIRSRSVRSGTPPAPDRVPDLGHSTKLDEVEVGRVFREEYGRSVAGLIRLFGDIDIAEDAVQEAFAIAVRKWPVEGLPPNPGGWITTTARNRAI